MHNLLVMTDLDGTLLDHYTYDFGPARPALDKLQELGIPLILNSSKTASEMLLTRKTLGNDAPFIVENGSTLFVPSRQGSREIFECVIYGLTRRDILDALQKINTRHEFRYQAFSDMDQQRLAEVTGLSSEQAHQALTRHFTEPLLWQDSDANLARFSNMLRPYGIKTIKGGRFVHLSGHADKSSCMQWLREYYAGDSGVMPDIIALGDSENDLPMLTEAEHAVLLKSPVKDYPAFDHPSLIRTEKPGPEGWNEAVLSLLDKYQQCSEC